MTHLMCPTCHQDVLLTEWNEYTHNVVSEFVGEFEFTQIEHRVPGTLYRCPKCHDEVITSNEHLLQTQ